MPSSSPLALGPVGAQAGAGTAGEEAGESERSVAWGGGCLSLAFKCLHLIVDDFLERVPRDEVQKQTKDTIFNVKCVVCSSHDYPNSPIFSQPR